MYELVLYAVRGICHEDFHGDGERVKGIRVPAVRLDMAATQDEERDSILRSVQLLNARWHGMNAAERRDWAQWASGMRPHPSRWVLRARTVWMTHKGLLTLTKARREARYRAAAARKAS